MKFVTKLGYKHYFKRLQRISAENELFARSNFNPGFKGSAIKFQMDLEYGTAFGNLTASEQQKDCKLYLRDTTVA